MVKHLVLDIETLGVEHGSQILSIGAVCGDEQFNVPNIQRTLDAKIDFNTVSWWMTTPQEAREIAFNQCRANCLHSALIAFNDFIERVQPDYFWGNSPDFDFGHLEYWYKKYHMYTPWQFWQLRDIRTIRDFVDPEKVAEIKAKYIPHIAIEDAKCEYEILQEFLKTAQITNKNI